MLNTTPKKLGADKIPPCMSGFLGAETLQFLRYVRTTGSPRVGGQGFLDLLAVKYIFPTTPWNGISVLTHRTKRKYRGLKTPGSVLRLLDTHTVTLSVFSKTTTNLKG